MMKTRTLPVTVLAIILALVAVVSPATGYENNKSGTALGGGAHRKINQIAGAIFMKEVVKGQDAAAFRKYDFLPASPGSKYKVAALNKDVPANALQTLFKPGGTTVSARMDWRDAEFDAAQKQVNFAFSSWVIEGGFTADEPERFNSLRHFYNPDSSKGVAWLTDIPRGGTMKMGENPKIDAVTWALKHPDNPYNWEKGKEYLEKALSATQLAQAQSNYAAAWRSLGETMHLMADMTVPAHVRNDSHPGNVFAALAFDDLRADAYEYLTNWYYEVEYGWTGGIMDPDLLTVIRETSLPNELMEKVADHVNTNFFSSDTIPYKNFFGTWTANNVGSNNPIVYDSPRIEGMDFNKVTGNYSAPDTTGVPMLMAHKSWLDDDGWDNYPGMVNLECVKSQAQRLIPIAIYSTARLMELFMPMVKVEVTGVDIDEKTNDTIVSGEIAVWQASEDGGYEEDSSTDLMQDTEQSLILCVRLTQKGGKAEDRMYLAPPTLLKNGEFEISLENCTNVDGLYDILHPKKGETPKYTNIEFGAGLDMGGVLVRSDYFVNADITGLWNVKAGFNEVIIPDALLNPEGLTEDEAKINRDTMLAAYGGSMVGKTYDSQVEIVKSGSGYLVKQKYDAATAASLAAAGTSMDLPATLRGSTFKAEMLNTYQGGSAGYTIEAVLSADKKSLEGKFTSTIAIDAGGMNIEYKGTWKASKAD